jgi:hypothetical protein
VFLKGRELGKAAKSIFGLQKNPISKTNARGNGDKDCGRPFIYVSIENKFDSASLPSNLRVRGHFHWKFGNPFFCKLHTPNKRAKLMAHYVSNERGFLEDTGSQEE